MRRVIIFAVSLLAAIVMAPAHSQVLCPQSKATTPDDDPALSLDEKTLTFQKGMDSVAWLEKDVWAIMRRNTTTQGLLEDTEGFGIPFPNTVMMTKGVLLKQHALLEQQRLEVAVLKLKAGQAASSDVEKQKRQFAVARRQFCEFLQKTQYVD